MVYRLKSWVMLVTTTFPRSYRSSRQMSEMIKRMVPSIQHADTLETVQEDRLIEAFMRASEPEFLHADIHSSAFSLLAFDIL